MEGVKHRYLFLVSPRRRRRRRRKRRRRNKDDNREMQGKHMEKQVTSVAVATTNTTERHSGTLHSNGGMKFGSWESIGNVLGHVD